MRKGCDPVTGERGMVSWVWLVVLVIVLAGAFAALKLLPRAQAPVPPPVAARGKIQPMQADSQTGPVAVRQATAPEGDAPLPAATGDTPSRTVSGQSGREPGPAEAGGSMGASLKPSEEEDASPAAPAANDDRTPAVQPGDDTATQEPTDAGQEETAASDAETGVPVSREVASNALKNEPAPDQQAAAAENQTAETVESQEAANDEGRPESGSGETSLFAVQVGAFRNKSFAQNMISRLNESGYPAYIFEMMTKDQQPLYLVRYGRFPSRDEAVRSAVAFKEKEKMPVLVVAAKSAE